MNFVYRLVVWLHSIDRAMLYTKQGHEPGVRAPGFSGFSADRTSASHGCHDFLVRRSILSTNFGFGTLGEAAGKVRDRIRFGGERPSGTLILGELESDDYGRRDRGEDIEGHR